jgi:ATP-dependent Clp protease ATP-binding subunit ClpX
MLPLNLLQERLAVRVLGQDQAVKDLCTIMYKWRIKQYAKDFGQYFTGSTSVLMLGDSGCGKTWLARQMAEINDLPFIEINAKSICQEGWHGKSFATLLEEGVREQSQLFGYKISEGIIFVDEFDKMLVKNITSGGDDNSRHLQASMLKYIEGMEMSHGHQYVNTNNYLFIFAGAFTDLEIRPPSLIGFDNENTDEHSMTDSLIKFGMLPEIAGRIQATLKLNQITDAAYKQLLTSEYFCLQMWKTTLKKLDINLEWNDDLLIDQARRSELGVRGLIQAVEKVVTDTMNRHVNEVDLDKFSPLYVRKQPKQLE